MDKISVVVPCWNEEEALPIYYREMSRVMENMNRGTDQETVDFELIFVDDGSTDGTYRIIKELNAAVMDVDLQDPPGLLPDMYRILKEEAYDSVATKRSTRTGEPRIRSFLSEGFYKFVNRISKTEIVNGARDYRLMNRKMVDAVLDMSEYNRFSKGIFGWVGFRTKWLEFENVERSAGETKWPLKKLFGYSMEGITGFSVAPLSLASIIGVLFCALSFLMILVIIVRTLVWGDPVSGWPSLACIIFMVSGVQLLCTGIVGQYLSKTYLETKRRPIFILKDSSEEDENK